MGFSRTKQHALRDDYRGSSADFQQGKEPGEE
jgi:hypothetical protein